MIYRIKQFLLGLTAKVYGEDIAFINQYLTPEQQELFFQLRESEQRHSLNVAYGCYRDFPNDLSLIQAALLHDIGKIGSNLTLLNKAFVVIADKINLKSSILPSFLQEAIYYKNHHPELGYRLLLNSDLEERVLMLIRDHHKENTAAMKDLQVLKHHDNLN